MQAKKKKESPSTVRCIDKAIDVLCCFSVNEPELGISEISTKLGMYKSTVHRILKTLEERGFVIQSLQNQKYRLGFRLFDLGYAVVSGLEVRDVALPLMRELSANTRETITLNIVDNNERVCIEKVESTEAVRNFVQIGGRNPLWLAGSGKLLLAHLSGEETERIIKGKVLGLTVQGSPIKPQELREELALIRERGYAVSHSERNIGSASVSAPIRNYEGICIAGLSISGPESRFTSERLQMLIEQVVATARNISIRLGWKGF
ncbi:IclR family transcriptional regulator [Paradesulfitobacterium aromaticivorans]